MDSSLGRPPPHLQGNLRIQISNKGSQGKSWKQRYIRVLKDTLSIFESEEKQKSSKRGSVLASVSLTEATIIDNVAEAVPKGFSVNWAFNVICGDETKTFLAKSAEEHQFWLKGLQYVKRFWLNRMSDQETNRETTECGEMSQPQGDYFSTRVTDIHDVSKDIKLAKDAKFGDVYDALHQETDSRSASLHMLRKKAAQLWVVTEDGSDYMIRKREAVHPHAQNGSQLFLLEHGYKLLVLFFDDNDIIAIPVQPQITVAEVAKIPKIVAKLATINAENFAMAKKQTDSDRETILRNDDKPLEVFYELENGHRKTDVKAKLVYKNISEEEYDICTNDAKGIPIAGAHVPDLLPVYKTPDKRGKSPIKEIFSSLKRTKPDFKPRYNDEDHERDNVTDEGHEKGNGTDSNSECFRFYETFSHTRKGTVELSEDSSVETPRKKFLSFPDDTHATTEKSDTTCEDSLGIQGSSQAIDENAIGLSGDLLSRSYSSDSVNSRHSTNDISRSPCSEKMTIISSGFQRMETIKNGVLNETGDNLGISENHGIRLSPKIERVQQKIVKAERQQNAIMSFWKANLRDEEVKDPIASLEVVGYVRKHEGDDLLNGKKDKGGLSLAVGSREDRSVIVCESNDATDSGQNQEVGSSYFQENHESTDKGDLPGMDKDCIVQKVEGNTMFEEIAENSSCADVELEAYLDEEQNSETGIDSVDSNSRPVESSTTSGLTREVIDEQGLNRGIADINQPESLMSRSDEKGPEKTVDKQPRSASVSEELQQYLDDSSEESPDVFCPLQDTVESYQPNQISVAGSAFGMILPTSENLSSMTTLTAVDRQDSDASDGNDDCESVPSIEAFMSSVNGVLPESEQFTEDHGDENSVNVVESSVLETSPLGDGTRSSENNGEKMPEEQKIEVVIAVDSLRENNSAVGISSTSVTDIPCKEFAVADEQSGIEANRENKDVYEDQASDNHNRHRKRGRVIKEKNELIKEARKERIRRLHSERMAEAAAKEAAEKEAAGKEAAEKEAAEKEGATINLEMQVEREATPQRSGDCAVDNSFAMDRRQNQYGRDMRSESPVQLLVPCASCDACAERPMQVIRYKDMKKVIENCGKVGQMHSSNRYDYICLSGVHLKNIQGTWELADQTEFHNESELTESLDSLKNSSNQGQEGLIASKIVRDKKIQISGGICCHWIPRNGGKWRIRKFTEDALELPRTEDTEDWKLRPIPSPCFGAGNEVEVESEAPEQRPNGLKNDPVLARVQEVTEMVSRKVSSTVKGVLSRVPANQSPEIYLPLELIQVRDNFLVPLGEAINQIRSHFSNAASQRHGREVGDDSVNPAIGWLIRKDFFNAFSTFVLTGKKEDSAVSRFVLGRSTAYNMWSLIKDVTRACVEEPVLQEIINVIQKSPFLFDDDLRARNFVCEALNWQDETCSEKLLITWFRTFVKLRHVINKFYGKQSLWRRNEMELVGLVNETRSMLSHLNQFRFHLHADFEHKELAKRLEAQHMALILQRESKDVDLDVMTFE